MTDEAKEEEGGKKKRRWLRIVLGVLVVLFVAGTIGDACDGANYDDCPKKADGSLDCSHQDFSGANLSEADHAGANFSGANLSGADLLRANLSGANFSGANLSGADLRGTDFSGANLKGADLRGADFHDSWQWPEADLSGADLRDANLFEANLKGANLKGANLKGANLKGADLQDVDLEGADLQDVDLEGATADADTEWPAGFNSIGAGVRGITTTTTTTAAPTTTAKTTDKTTADNWCPSALPLPKGFNLPPCDVIDKKATLVDSGDYEINIKVRNSGTASAYYCIVMEYKLNEDDLFAKNSHLILRGLGSWLDVTYGTDYAIPPDGQEKLLILEKRRDERGLMFSEYVGRFEYKIRRFEKLSSPAGPGCRS